MKLTVLGSGAWGVTLANLWQERFSQITLWGREVENALINRQFLKPLPFTLSNKVELQKDLAKATQKSQIIILAIATEGVRLLCQQLKSLVDSSTLIINVAKGLEASSLKRLTQVISEELPNPIMTISGPNLALEVFQKKPTAAILAGKNLDLLVKYQKLLTLPHFCLHITTDLIGVELGGAFKNIIAIASGYAAAQNYGENAKGVILSLGLKEIVALSTYLGAKAETIYGLSGLGDLITTCSELSRNYQTGYWLGKGKKLPEVLEKLGAVAEGVATTKYFVMLANQYHIDAPLINSVYQLLSTDNLNPKQFIESFVY